jgi:hypothetical protein
MQISTHSFFASSSSRLPRGSVLEHLCDIYITRNASIWNREDVHKWVLKSCRKMVNLYDTDPDLLFQTMKSQVELYENLSSLASPLCKYRNVLLEDFLEDYPRLPPEVNPLDARFADPAAFARPARNERGQLHIYMFMYVYVFL